MTAAQWIAVTAIVFGAGGLGAILTALLKPSSQAELIKAAQDAGREAINDLRQEIDRLQHRVGDLEADNEVCQAENRALKQQLHSLEEVLCKAGIPITARELPGSFVVIENNRTTVLKPQKRGGK